MKKTILTLTLLAVFGLMFATPVNAQLGIWEDCTLVRPIEVDGTSYSEGATVTMGQNEGQGSLVCMLNAVYRAINVLIWFMVALVVLFVIYGGYKILTARGVEDDINAGKKMITFAIIGVFIAAVAWAVPWIVNFMIS